MEIGFLTPLAGIAMLTLGRRLFWFFVACMGFWLGYSWAQPLGAVPSEIPVLLIALVAGAIGGLVAVFFQKVAIGLAGFGAGGQLALMFVSLFHLFPQGLIWLVFLAGGLLGAVFLYMLFDWGLIVLSSLIGAFLVIEPLPWNPGARIVVFFLLAVGGMVFQTWLFVKKTR
jgi:hypothetical protein